MSENIIYCYSGSGNCLNMAKEVGFKMPGEENAVRVYDKALEMGLGKEDFSASIKVVRAEGEK